MKKKLLAIMLSSSLVLSGCKFWDKIVSIFKKDEPESGEKQQAKTIESIIKVNAPSVIEQDAQVNPNDFTVNVKYSDGSTGVEPVTSVTLDTSVVGDNIQGSVLVGSLSATFTIKVYSNQIENHTGTFDTSHAEVESGAGFVDVTLKNADQSDSIKARAENATFSEESLVIPANSYFVMYNEIDSPLTGINDLACEWQHSTSLTRSEDIAFALYFSYNYLTLEDILAGYYQDLQAYVGTFNVHGASYSFSTASNSISVPNARYFLAVVQSPSVDLKLTALSVETKTAVPAAVEKGTYVIPEAILNSFRGFEHGLPSLGNGSFMYTHDEHDNQNQIIAFQKKAKFDYMFGQFLDNGFVFATELMGMKIYQKQAEGESYYTYVLNSIEFGGYSLFQILDAGLQACMIEQTTWPQDKINQIISSAEFKAMITDPGFTGNLAYTFINTTDSDAKKEANLLITDKDGTLANAKANGAIMKAYMHRFVDTYGFTSLSENDEDFSGDEISYYASVQSADLKYKVSCGLSYSDGESLNYISFSESIFGEFPVNVFREMVKDVTFPIISTASGEFTYEESSSSLTITGVGVSDEELTNYLDVLEAYGLSFGHSYNTSGNYEYWYDSFLKVDSTGAHQYSFYVYKYTNYIRIYVSKYNANTYQDISGCLSDFLYSLRSKFAEDLGSTFKNGSFVKDSDQKCVYCIGFGSTEAQIIKDVCEYDANLGAYVYYNEESLYDGAVIVDIEIKDSYLVLRFKNIDGTHWGNYKNENATNNYNGLVSDVFTYLSIEESSASFNIGENDLVFYRNEYSSYIYAYGLDVEEVMEQYKAALLANANITYSTYQDRYYDAISGVSLSIHVNVENALPYAEIEISNWQTFKDYDTYANIEDQLSDFGHMDMAPSLLSVAESTDKVFLVESAWDSYASISTTAEVCEAYKELLDNDPNFTFVSDRYITVDEDGNKMEIYVNIYSNSISFSYYSEYYSTFTDVKSEAVSSGVDILDNFVIPTDTGKIFHLSSCWNNVVEIEFVPSEFNKISYINALNVNGYLESSDAYGNVCYCKTDGHKSYSISILDNRIEYRVLDFETLSYEEFANRLETYNFDSDRLAHFVNLPSMADNYFVLSAYSESVDVVIVNDSFSTSEYAAAVIAAGYEYQADDNCYIMGQARIRLMSYYGFTLIRFDDSTIMYKTLDRVIDKAVKNGFDLWRLEYLCLPSQNDAVYAYSYAYGSSLSMYYDSENFDVDAYKAELIDAGYTTSDERSYTKGDANIYISSTYIELRYYGNPVTTTNYFNSLLIEDGITLTAEAAYPEESLGLNISFAYISGSNSVHHINMNLINPSEETVNKVSINGNIIVEYSVSAGSYNAILSIYDLDKVETSMTLYDALYASSFQLSYLTGWESLIDYELYGSNKYFKINDGEGAFATLKALLSENAASSKIYEYDDSVENVLTFKINDYSSAPVYKIELVSANIISFTIIYQ